MKDIRLEFNDVAAWTLTFIVTVIEPETLQ